jgi:uncharacterized protein (TIGR02246 family)
MIECSVDAIHRQMIEAWNAGDAAAFAAPFVVDADFVAFEGTHLHGHDEILAFHRQLFATVLRGSRLTGEVKFVRRIGPGLAVIHSTVQVILPGGTSPSPSRDSMQFTVVREELGQWRGVSLMNARVLTLERQALLDRLDAMPARDQRQVEGLVESLTRLPEPG